MYSIYFTLFYFISFYFNLIYFNLFYYISNFIFFYFTVPINNVLSFPCRAWGHDQILLQVESDNKVARTFYRKLGFEELLTDMSEKRYDTNGLYLTMVTAPKVLLRKVIK